jgi:hypothetical protein
MKLSKVLEITNFQEKGSFYKILTNLIEKSSNQDAINKVLNDSNIQFKELDNENISKLFDIVGQDYIPFITGEITSNISQIDLILDILIRDGNSILSVSWFDELYKKELKKIENDSKQFIELIESESKEIEESRRRDYIIYAECCKTAYCNDSLNNLDKKVTPDEYSILKSLSNSLDLSNQEIRLIHNSIIPISILDKEVIIKNLKDLGIALFSKKTNKIYIADEIIKFLREIRGKEIADKYFRRLLNSMDEKVINSISVNFLQDSRSWILMPTKLEFSYWIQNDHLVDKITTISLPNIEIDPKDDKVQIKPFEINHLKNVKARYIKIKATNFGKLPEGHQGFGGDAYIFVDEIVVK